MAGVATSLARVLIVDDRAEIRTIVATRLRIDPAFEVVGEAANGAEAIARISELRPHLMILDLQMPVMSGEEVIPIVRSLAPRLRILVFSAYAGGYQRLQSSGRPDSEVRKGGGLGPLVRELHRLVDEPPPDLVDVDLGLVEVEECVRAAETWSRLHPAARESAAERKQTTDFLALVGVFLALAEPLQVAASAGCRCAPVCFTTRLEAGRAARRALFAIDDGAAALLEPLRSRLLAGLPPA
jgi:CheY-like chemotaxis protein